MTTKGTIRLAHGSGGKLTHDLVERVFLPRLRNEILEELADELQRLPGDVQNVFRQE